MKDYLINSPVMLRDGIVRLSPEMAKGREHKLEPVKGKKNHYRITAPNQFKVGQEIGYDGELPKNLAVNMTEISEAEAEAAAKKAAAEAEKAAKKEAAEAEKASKKAAEEAARARAELEAAAKAEWEGSAELRERYGNDFTVYLTEVLGE